MADERGDNMPRDEMARMLVELGEPAPESKRAAAGAGGGAGRLPLPAAGLPGRRTGPPARSTADEGRIGRRIYETVCADCWTDWLKNYSIKVINELRLDLSTERGQEEYDRYMREFLGIE